MRIALVVTLISEDAAFGGPVSVARAHAAELARRGHDVVLLAGWDGKACVEVSGVDVRLHRVRRVLPGRGFFGLAAWGLLADLRHLRSEVDVVHVHLARDLITLTAARTVSLHAPTVIQPHGMVMPDGRAVARIVDAIATRPLLKSAKAVATLTEIEREGLRQVAGHEVALVDLPNGIEVLPSRRTHTAAAMPTVLFCARLHPRKRVLAFAQMARELIAGGERARFVVAGPDEGDLSKLLEFIEVNGLRDRLVYVGALDPQQVRSELAAAAVFVLPSDREPFPMTLLEAMSEGTPAVLTRGCMIAERLDGAGGPIVTDGSSHELATAVASVLSNPDAAQSISVRSRELVEERFSIAAVVDSLESIYRRAQDIRR